MAASLVALRHDGMNARCHKYPRLIDACRRAEEDDASVPQRLYAVRRRCAKMEAHDLRLVGQECGKHVVVLDEALVDLGQGSWRRGTKAIEFGA